MYRNCIYNNREKKITLYTWNEQGERVEQEHDFAPFLFLEDKEGEYESIYGKKLTRKYFENSYARNKYIKDFGIIKSYENLNVAQQFLIENFWECNTDEDFQKFPLKIMFIDIETYSNDGKFPDIEDPQHPINLITCYDSTTSTYYTFGINKFDENRVTGKKFKYVHCKTEERLLKIFLKFLAKDYPDVISGWNSAGFDIPYIINRIAYVLDENWQKMISPVGWFYEKYNKDTKFGEPDKEFVIQGISSVDYKVLYQKFKLEKQESYKLDYIAEVELDENKLEYDGQLWELARDDWDRFVEYNIHDVELLVRLDDTLRYMKILRFLANIGLCNLDRAIDTLPIMNGALAVQARRLGKIIPTFKRTLKTEKNPGAFVREPLVGLKENIVSFDANSLYPSVMISLNLSPETKIGRVEENNDGSYTIFHRTGRKYELSAEQYEKFIITEDVAVTKANFLFSQKKRGIVPMYLDWLYAERKTMQKKMRECRLKAEDKSLSEEEQRYWKDEEHRYDSVQYAYKINLNSLYGYMGNAYAPMGDDDIASSVTLTGQAAIKKSAEIFFEAIKIKYENISEDELLDSMIYGDTDSVYVSLKLLEKEGIPLFDGDGNINKEFQAECDRISNYMNLKMSEWAIAELRSTDPRFVFKQETICDAGLFLKKKHYVLHMVDDEGFRCSKFKYKGVSLVKVEIPRELKPYMKKIVESMILDRDKKKSDKLFNDCYDKFKKMPIESISIIKGINTFNKYVENSDGYLRPAKGMQAHMKAAYYHNLLLRDLGIEGKYEKLRERDKIKVIYLKTPNKFNIDVVGYSGKYPKEFDEIFTVDVEQMFTDQVYTKMKYFYDSVKWNLRKPTENVRVELEDLLSI